MSASLLLPTLLYHDTYCQRLYDREDYCSRAYCIKKPTVSESIVPETYCNKVLLYKLLCCITESVRSVNLGKYGGLSF